MKRYLIFSFLVLLFYPAIAMDTLKVSYRMIPVDSIPDGYYCLVVDCGFSRKAKYEIYYNNYKAYAEIDIASQKLKWTLWNLQSKKARCSYHAYILIERDTSLSNLDIIPINIYRKKLFGIFSKPVISYIQYCTGAKYCVLENPVLKKNKSFLITIWTNTIRRCM
jgi:hypothetical protein